MSTYINQYSLLIAALALLALVGFIIFRHKPRPAEIIAFAVIALGIVAAWFVIRPTQTLLVGEAAAVQAQIGAGKPVLLEFQSPY